MNSPKQDRRNTLNRSSDYKDKQHHSVPRHAKAVIRPNCFRLVDPSPEKPKSYITGRYQDEDGIFTLHVNQSGTHIECFLAFTVAAKDKGRKPVYRLQGEEVSGKFVLHKVNEPSATFGTVWRDSSGPLKMIIEDHPALPAMESERGGR